MKKFYLYLLLSALCYNSFSQSKLESLKKVLAKLPPEGRSFAGDTMRVKVLCEMGEAFINRDSTFFFLKSALKISENNSFLEGSLKVNLIFDTYYSEQPLRRLEFLMKALAISELLKDYRNQIAITLKIKSRFSELEDFKNSLRYAILHSELCKKYGTIKQYIMSLNSIGIAYFGLKNYKKSLKYFELCRLFNQKIKSNQIENIALINIAKIKVIENKSDEALLNFKKAISIDDGFDDRIPFVANEIAKIYLNQDNLNQALLYAKMSEEKNTSKNVETKLYIYNTLYQIYEKRGDTKLAYFYLQNYSNLKLREDSIKNSKLVNFISLDYKNQKQIQEINALNIENKEKENRNNLLLFGVLASIITIGIILFFYNSLRSKNIQINLQKSEIENLNRNLEIKVDERTLELKVANEELIRKNYEITEALFKGQSIERKRVATELHDNLGSTLSAIKWRLEAIDGKNLTEKERKVYLGVMEMMNNAYADVRHISHNLLPAEFEEKGLIEAIKKLCDDITQSGKLDLVFKCEGIEQMIDKKIALELYSICMELINNILKHSQATKAEISLENQKQMLKLVSRDNGIGVMSNQNTKGMGLKNLNNRLKTIGGKLDVIENEDWKTEVIILI